MSKGDSGVRQVAVPASFRTRSTLQWIDYADAFAAEVDGIEQRTAVQWARAIFAAAPGTLQQSLPAGWRALGLQLGPAQSEELVFGWEVRRSSPEFALVGGSSRVGMPAELAFERRGHQFVLGTLIQHRNPVTRTAWRGFAPVHRQVVRYLLTEAVRSLQPSG